MAFTDFAADRRHAASDYRATPLRWIADQCYGCLVLFLAKSIFSKKPTEQTPRRRRVGKVPEIAADCYSVDQTPDQNRDSRPAPGTAKLILVGTSKSKESRITHAQYL